MEIEATRKSVIYPASLGSIARQNSNSATTDLSRSHLAQWVLSARCVGVTTWYQAQKDG